MFTLSKYADKRDTSTLKLNSAPIKTSKERAWSRDRRIHTYPECSGGLQPTTLNDTAATGPSPSYSVLGGGDGGGGDDGLICRHPDVFPGWKTMKSYGRPLYQRPQFQSPAKVFAKLKAKALRDAGGTQTQHGGEVVCRSRENGGSVFLTPRKGKENAEALTISPSRAPCVYPPMKTPGQGSSSSRALKATPSRASKDPVRTPSKGQPQPCSNSTFATEAVISLERCPLITPDMVFAHTKEEERKRMREREWPPVVLEHPRLHDLSTAFMSKRQDPSSLRNLMSPAKVFSQMKKRTSKRQQEAGDVRNGFAGHSVVSRMRPTSTVFGQEETVSGTQMDTFSHLPKRGFPAKQFNAEAADGPFESSRKDEPLFPAVKPQPVLVEDPLVIHSPQLFFPKKHKAVFKQNPAASENRPKSKQQGSGYELTQWTIKFNREGLYLDGVRTSDNILWHSTVIAERISRLVLKTVSGSTYTLIGKMNNDVDSKLPKWLLSKFTCGFPVRWKMHLENFRSQPKTAASSTGAESQTRCPSSAKPTIKYPNPKSEKTPMSTPSVTPAFSLGMKTSRSGRMLKPPLEFWKGGRVIVDASMNVTIHEAYETTVCMAPSNTPDTILESPPPKQHGGVFRQAPQRSEFPGRPAAHHQPPGPQRKVKAASQGGRAKGRKPASDPIQPPEKGQPRGRVSPEDQEAHAPPSTASQPQRLLHEAAPRTARAPAGGRGVLETALPRKRNRPASKEPPVAHSSTPPSDEDVPVRRKIQRKGTPRNVIAESQSSGSSSKSSSKSLNSSVGCGAVPRKGKGKRGGSRPNTTHSQPKTRSKKSVGGADCASKTASPRKRNLPASKQPPVAHSSASPSDENVPVRRKVQRKGTPQNVIPESQSSASQSQGSSDGCGAWPRKGNGKGKGKGGSRTPKPAPAPVSVLGSVGAQARKRGGQSTASKRVDTQEEEEEKWTEAELMRLKEAVASFPKHMGGYWVNVAFMVGTRSPEECQMQQMLQGSGGEAFSKTDVAPKKKKVTSTTGQEATQITAAVGTLKRKQQVRQFMEAMPKDDHDDAFSSAAMQTRRFQMPSMSPGGEEQGFSLSNLEPLTPRGCGYPAAKTPPCLHITPGMMGSVNRKNDDKYVYRLQKRIKRRQINACKVSPPMKTFPLKQPNMRKCGNMDDDFVVREMYPNNNGAYDESGEEEDFYFSDSF